MLRALLATVCLFATAQLSFSAEKMYDGKPIKVLLATGGGYHDYETQSKIIPEAIKARGNFEVTVIGPNWETAQQEMLKEDWAKGYDIVVYNLCDAHNTNKTLIHNIAKVHSEDKTPAVVIHAAMHSFHWKMGKDKTKYEGEEWVNVTGMCSGNHGKKAPITVKNVKPDHPIMKGLPKEWKTPKGELYNSHEMLPTAITLATGDNGDEKQGAQICVWVNEVNKTRIFGTTIGHHNETMMESIYGDLLVRGMLWACKKEAVAKKKKIVFVAGKQSHGRGAHEHKAGSMLLAKLLNENTSNIDAVVHKNGWPQDSSIFDDADAIVMYCDGGRNHMVVPHIDRVNEMAKKGIGVSCLHYGVEAVKGKAGDSFLNWIGGYFEMHWSVNPHWIAEFKSFPDHPVTRGVKPFSLNDEWYYHMRFREDMKDVVPVLSAHPPKSTLKRKDGAHSGNPDVRKAVENGEIQHLGWVATREGGGRGFGFTGGHFHKGWKDDNFRKIVLNAIAWTAKAEIPADGITSKTPTDAEMEANQD